MPTLRFPSPENDDDFDSLVRQIAERKFGVEATRYGRNGQAQHGVDITFKDHHARLFAIQSKHTAVLTTAMMDEEIDKLLGLTKPTCFPEVVFEFIFATSAQRDTKQSDHANLLMKRHTGLRVTVWPWEHINELLNSMPALAGEYCRAVLTPVPLEDVRRQHAIALRTALNRPALLDGFQHERDFNDQSHGLRGIVGFLTTGNLYDRNGTLVLSVLPYTENDDYGRALESLAHVLRDLIRHIETHSGILSAYSLVPGGRVIHPSDLAPAKAYLQYETKRLKVTSKANKVLATFDLAPLG